MKKAARKATTKAPSAERPVLVTTAHRGVFFGYLQSRDGDTVKLRFARNCVYWSSDVKGFLGLANVGPSSSCRVGKAADIELFSVTCIADVTPEAVAKWEASPWA